MKYCINCKLNLGNAELLENDNNTCCPNCESIVIELKNKKLITTIQDINEAFYNLSDNENKTNSQVLIRNAKVIENGEKKLKSQLMKKQKQLLELRYEIEVINSLGKDLNYNLGGE